MSVFHQADLFICQEAITRIWQHDWLKLVGKILSQSVGAIPTYVENRCKVMMLTLAVLLRIGAYKAPNTWN